MARFSWTRWKLNRIYYSQISITFIYFYNNTGWWMPPCAWSKSDRIWREEMYTPTEGRWTHFVRSLLANLSGHFKGPIRRHSRWFYRRFASFRQGRQRFHLNGWAPTSVDDAGRKTYRRWGRTATGQPRGLARQRQLRRIRTTGYERLEIWKCSSVYTNEDLLWAPT